VPHFFLPFLPAMIATHCKYALKEWAITVEFLRSGRQILLLRKGGILEQPDGFSVEHPEFFLFPTYLHQNLQALHHEARSEFEKLQLRSSLHHQIRFDTYACTERVIKVTHLEALRQLDGQHTLGWEAVQQRYYYRNQPGLHLLLVRIYQLAAPQELPNRSEYDGCVSWVELEQQLPTGSATPVLCSEEFQKKVEEIQGLVEGFSIK
jgi:hypothetical protein